VKAGQVVAEVEAPELDQQILQARAAIDQASSGVQQAEAAIQQGRANENLARLTAGRMAALLGRGVISKQDNDNAQAQYAAQQANTEALVKAAAAMRSSVAAAEANLARLNQLKTYQTVRAPFEGVITLRNVDTGALVNEGSTLLFRVAQTATLRTYINLPQADAESVRVGQHAIVSIAELPGRKFDGTVTRTSNALDPATRTLLTEVQVRNADGALMPGMFAEVDLTVPRKYPPLLIPGDTLVVRSDGPQVAVVKADGTVHFTRIQLGRDYGDRLEVISGLEEGQRLAVNPSDEVREGAKVNPVATPEKAAPGRSSRTRNVSQDCSRLTGADSGSRSRVRADRRAPARHSAHDARGAIRQLAAGARTHPRRESLSLAGGRSGTGHREQPRYRAPALPSAARRCRTPADQRRRTQSRP
jgi:RND family efflux transporter MFP subunit